MLLAKDSPKVYLEGHQGITDLEHLSTLAFSMCSMVPKYGS